MTGADSEARLMKVRDDAEQAEAEQLDHIVKAVKNADLVVHAVLAQTLDSEECVSGTDRAHLVVAVLGATIGDKDGIGSSLSDALSQVACATGQHYFPRDANTCYRCPQPR